MEKCLIITQPIRDLAQKFQGETPASIANLIGLWQEKNSKGMDEYPSASELNKFRSSLIVKPGINGVSKNTPIKWSRFSDNSYEVSTKGDKRFSALSATFAPNTTIEGVDVSGKTIEYVYQTIIKKSGKGKAPAFGSKLNLNPTNVSRQKREEKLEYIKSLLGEPLRYDTNTSSDMGMYKVYFERGTVEINPSIGSVYLNKGENIPNNKDIDLFIGASIAIEQLVNLEDFSYVEGYLPLWKEWANQNPGLISELITLLQDKVLTDQFANTRVSQARALSDILNESISNIDEAVNSEEPEEISKPFETSNILTLEEQNQVNLDFDPQVRRDRATMISRFFSNEITSIIQEEEVILKDRINNTQDEKEKIELQEDLEVLNRRTVIDKYGVEQLFRRVQKKYFTDYLESSRDQRVNAEYFKLTQDLSIEGYSDEELRGYAEELADENLEKFERINRNYKALVEEASATLLFTEGLQITLGQQRSRDPNYSEETAEPGEEGSETLGEQPEEKVKDGWQINYLHVSNSESLSQEVRRVISTIPRLDREGYVETDDLGYERYLDSSYVVASLIDGLRNMIGIDDMIPAMLQVARNKPWVHGVIERIQSDEAIYSQFFQNFRKDFMPYTIIKSTQDTEGALSFKTISINTPEGIYYLLDAWRDNYEQGNQLSKNPVYNKQGLIDNKKVEYNYEILMQLTNALNKLDTEGKLTTLNAEKSPELNTLVEILKAVGISPNLDVLLTAINNVNTNPKIKIADPVNSILSDLNVILKGLKDNKAEIKDDGRIDLINSFGSAYNSIAQTLAYVTEDAIESSIHQGGKSYYSHVVPAYLEKILKNLKSVHGNEERFMKFINDEFGQYSFFFKNGKWLNGWLEQIVNDPNARDILKHDMVLSYNNKEYINWDSLDYALVCLERYNLQNKVDAGNAWYYVPVLSDTESAEFIHFKKIRTGDELDENAKKRHFSDIIIDKMSNLVLQEYNRIQLVATRDEAMSRGDKKVQAITNFDIVRNEDGSIRDIGGAEFKFLPALNDLASEDGTSFLSILGQMAEGNDPNLNEFIRESLRLIMEEGFEKDFRKWSKIGLLDTTESGKYLYLPYRTETNAKEALREYYYNSKYATSQFEQLVITDLAQYKNLEDFQKRFKQIHAPALRLNTGSKHGRKIERTVYLVDSITTSDFIDDIKDILQKRVQEGLMSKVDMDNIVSQYKKVNVADAQAYRSLDSYRAIMDMQGKWTDSMEQTFNRFKQGTWDMRDFDTLWQPLKPFVYTQVKVDSGVEGFGPLKQGVQHKNSEYLLLAMNELIGGKLHSSPKLRAISKYMEDNDIDVVQFESAVKVGLQGAVDLNDATSFEDTYNRLQDSSHLEGSENPNVIHSIPYEDYGIQVQTPEHSIDSSQGIGTQLRKLITADMADDILVTVGNKTLTKKEWLYLYNSITTENIIQSFKQIDEIFADPKKIEKILLEQINGSPRYGRDLLQACTLDADGNFNIPLYDPVQSGRIQQLINSLLKSRITKQKTKGGSLIQLSGYGLTDELKIVRGKDGGIKCFECYMPWYTKKYFKELIDPKTGQLDIRKVPEDLRKLIGYRTPTEDKYSMVPLLIKGFLPQQSGGAIMLPEEITTISGSDFKQH